MHVSSSSTILNVKENISKALSQTDDDITSNNIRVYIPDKNEALQDDGIISDHIPNTEDLVLHVVFRKSGFDENDETEESWEEVEISESYPTD